jgi:translation elongation factor EF-Tu-like GTPase
MHRRARRSAQPLSVMAATPPYQRPSSLPDLEAQVRYLSSSEGGRKSPVYSGYRPNHDFGLPGELNDGQHEYPGREWVQPGDSATALLWLLAPERQRRRLYVGFEFKVQEGPRIVGIGTITNVLNAELRNDA